MVGNSGSVQRQEGVDPAPWGAVVVRWWRGERKRKGKEWWPAVSVWQAAGKIREGSFLRHEGSRGGGSGGVRCGGGLFGVVTLHGLPRQH